MKRQALIFVISGPSGSGKTTLLERVIRARELKGKIVRSISCATRPKRSGERNGVDYFFVSREEFEKRKKAKKILEWTKYLGYYYGTPKEFIDSKLAESKHIIMCVDVKGAMRIRRLYPEKTKTIFVMPPSLGVLRERIRNRCNKTKQEEIRQRIRLAREELLASHSYDYCLVNKELSSTISRLTGIILSNINIKR